MFNQNIQVSFYQIQAKKGYRYIPKIYQINNDTYLEETIPGISLSDYLKSDHNYVQYHTLIDIGVQILSQIHEVGICHNHPTIRNFKVDNNGEMWLINFKNASLYDNNNRDIEFFKTSLDNIIVDIMKTNQYAKKWWESHQDEFTEAEVNWKIYKIYAPILEHNQRKLSGYGYVELFLLNINKTETKLMFKDINSKIKYVEDTNIVKPTIHLGQRKLFLSELLFLTLVMDKYDDQEYVVYAGAAPGNHTYKLLTYFPNIKLILVDPNKFNLYNSDQNDIEYLSKTQMDKWINIIKKSSKHVFIYNGYFTTDMAEKLGGLNPLFISDIRTGDGDEFPSDMDIILNLAQQYIWTKKINPKYGWLKFRHPFHKEATINVQEYAKTKLIFKEYGIDIVNEFNTAKELGIDFENDYNNGVLRYMDGEIYVQAYAPKTSTETRLFVGNDSGIKNYGEMYDYENKFFYYNSLERGLIIHDNPYSDSTIGFDHCGDCSLESLIWTNYSTKYNMDIDIPEQIKQLTNMLNKGNMFTEIHGYLFPEKVEVFIKKVMDFIKFKK